MNNLSFSIFSLSFLLFIFSAWERGVNSSPIFAKLKPEPVLVRGPYLQAATPVSIVIRWRTDVLTRSRVSYGVNPSNLDKTIRNLDWVTEHEIKLTDLDPRTKYYYSIGGLKDTLQGDENNFFVTLPLPGKEDFYRIGVFGDCGYLGVRQAKVRDEFLKYLGNNNLDAWILLGDNAYNDGTDVEFQAKFFNVYKDNLLKNSPVYPAPGNHDYHDIDFGSDYAQTNHNTAYFQNFTMPIDGEAGGIPSNNQAYYSFDYGNIHFISLDSYGKELNNYFLYDTISPQVQWLKKDLEANKNRQWVVVFTHFPPHTKGTHNSDTDTRMTLIRENLAPILERYGVDLFLAGHSHVYERSKLLSGFFGKDDEFNEKYNLSSSTGLNDGSPNSEPYIKKSDVGTMYVVTGSSSYVGKPEVSFPHNAMYYSNADDAGAAILEVQGNKLEMKWICEDGVIRDKFTIIKSLK
jgi:3',5'-cyclic AMP phosphodiesterase CpdA